MTTTQRKARRKKVVKKVIRVFTEAAIGLVKVWHKNKSFRISEADAVNLTFEQLQALAGEKEDEKDNE